MYTVPCGIPGDYHEDKENCGGSCSECRERPVYHASAETLMCPIFKCAVIDKKLETCAECSELPCKIYYDWKRPGLSKEEHESEVQDQVIMLLDNE